MNYMTYEDFLKLLPDWSKNGLLCASHVYKQLISNLDKEKYLKLLYIFNELDELGVSGFGYRCFWSNGQTALFAVNQDWHKLVKDHGFNELNISYVKAELIFVKQNKINFLTRSRDKTTDKYLMALNQTSVNNGVVLYNFSKLRAEVYYFQCLTPEQRDFVLNKLSYVQIIIENSRNILRFVLESESFRSERLKCLSKEQIGICFDNIISSSRFVFEKNGEKIILSASDLECLFFLKFGTSINQIAKNINRSQSAVKDRIDSLKHKFNLNTKEELSLLARNELSLLIKNINHKII